MPERGAELHLYTQNTCRKAVFPAIFHATITIYIDIGQGMTFLDEVKLLTTIRGLSCGMLSFPRIPGTSQRARQRA